MARSGFSSNDAILNQYQLYMHGIVQVKGQEEAVFKPVTFDEAGNYKGRRHIFYAMLASDCFRAYVEQRSTYPKKTFMRQNGSYLGIPSLENLMECIFRSVLYSMPILEKGKLHNEYTAFVNHAIFKVLKDNDPDVNNEGKPNQLALSDKKHNYNTLFPGAGKVEQFASDEKFSMIDRILTCLSEPDGEGDDEDADNSGKGMYGLYVPLHCSDDNGITSSVYEFVPVHKLFRLLHQEAKDLLDHLPFIKRQIINQVKMKTTFTDEFLFKEIICRTFAWYSVFLPLSLRSVVVTPDVCRKVMIMSIMQKDYGICYETDNREFNLEQNHSYPSIVIMTDRSRKLNEIIKCRKSEESKDGVNTECEQDNNSNGGINDYFEDVNIAVDNSELHITFICKTIARDILYTSISSYKSGPLLFILDSCDCYDNCEVPIRYTPEKLIETFRSTFNTVSINNNMLTCLTIDEEEHEAFINCLDETLANFQKYDYKRLGNIRGWLTTRSSENDHLGADAHKGMNPSIKVNDGMDSDGKHVLLAPCSIPKYGRYLEFITPSEMMSITESTQKS